MPSIKVELAPRLDIVRLLKEGDTDGAFARIKEIVYDEGP